MGPIPRKILHPYKLASLVKEGSLSANNQNTNVNIKLLLFNADLPARYGMTIVVKKNLSEKPINIALGSLIPPPRKQNSYVMLLG